MAADEVLLRRAAVHGQPLLRVYRWSRPAVSFGYFQPYPVELAAQYELVRRPTGGGRVYHGTDTTYTVVAPPGHWLHRARATEAYCAIHRAVAAALAEPVTLLDHPAPSPRGRYDCFQQPVSGDVMVQDRKVAGGAQRRSRWGLLHQGSIAQMIDPRELAEAFARTLSIEWNSFAPTPDEIVLIEQLAREKYATRQWNYRIS